MGAYDRRIAIWRKLCVRRSDTAQNLAAEFQVCRRTIYYDFQYLTLHFPVVYVKGSYQGGIRLADGYVPGDTLFTTVEISLLQRVATILPREDAVIMHSIILKCSIQ